MLPTSYLDTIKTLVTQANQQFVLPRFRNPQSQGLDNKTHSYDLVTQADREAEAFLIDALTKIFPSVYVVGEESISDDPKKLTPIYSQDYTFLLDPVDGTFNFTQGSPIFGTIVSILKKGTPIAGLLYDPIVNDWVIAETGSGAHYERGPQHTPLYKTPVRVPLFINNLSGLTGSGEDIENALKGQYGILRNYWSSNHDYRFMAMGSATGFISRFCKPWDHAAGSVVLEEAGGKVAFMDDQPYTIRRDTGPLLAVQNKDTFEDIKHKLNSVAKRYKPNL